jgi:TonB family protein
MSQGPVSTPHTGNAAANEAHEPQIAVTSVIVAEATGAVTPATEAVVAALTEAATSQAAASGAAAKEPPRQATAAELPAAWRSSVRAIAVAALAVLAVVWIGWRLFHSHTDNLPRPASGNSQLASRQAASPPAFARNPAAPASAPASAAVLHRVIPDVPRHARESIRGRIKIMVRVTVDHSGNVVGERLVSSGSSRYFARLASEAAAKWKFAAADEQGSREWLLRFEFTRGGVTGQVAAPPT